jgi:uncharacterized protein
MKRTPNRLIKESSPYLLQHAYNPVDWFPYGKEAFDRAKKENKTVLISIGYSACHWCHVMETECFEDPEVATWMNKHFINIKVDREERPDVDMFYMAAVQAMTQHGGWPLNCFTLPDGKPIYGGTYFPKIKWLHVLKTLADIYREEPEKVIEYGEKLTAGLQEIENREKRSSGLPSPGELQKAIEKWTSQFDPEDGGPNRAPKFPLPSNYRFLLEVSALRKDELWGEKGVLADLVTKHVELTLDKMALGGICDQTGGGFYRYSTDRNWKIPHFEKMLYDNAQLLSLYSHAFYRFRKPFYRETALGIIAFCNRELLGENGLYYSALDADSEGEEGKFYIWKKEELEKCLGDLFPEAEKLFHLDEKGYWENGNYNLVLKKEPENPESFRRIKEILLAERAKRVRPGLDDKQLCSWNSLMLTGLTDGAFAFQDDKLLARCRDLAQKMKALFFEGNEILHCRKKEGAPISGFLEDYAFFSGALLNLFSKTGDESYLKDAQFIIETAIQKFGDPYPYFYFTRKEDGDLPIRQKELSDNVIPSSNAGMASSLYYLGLYTGASSFSERALAMLGGIGEDLQKYPPGYSHWMETGLKLIFPASQIVVVGNSVDELRKEAASRYHPNLIFVFSHADSGVSILKGKYEAGKTNLYHCRENTCSPPCSCLDEVFSLLERNS